MNLLDLLLDFFDEMLMNSFGPNVEFSEGNEKRGFSKKKRRNFKYEDHGRGEEH